MLNQLYSTRVIISLVFISGIISGLSGKLAAQNGNIESLLIHMNNIPDGNRLFPGSNGIINIQRGRFSQRAYTLDGMASFHNIPPKTNYTISALNKSNSHAFDNALELWGRWTNVRLDHDVTELSFTRELPIIWDINSFHARKNSFNPSLEVGQPVTFEVFVKNPSSQKLRSKVVMMVKNENTGRIERIERDITIESFEEQEHVLLNYIPQEAGEYYIAPGIYLQQGINQWSDCWDWPEDPAFIVTGEHRYINFAGFEWEVKNGFGNPGNNIWSNDPAQVWVDENERLQLVLQKKNNRWYSAEVISRSSFGYGTYTFYIDAEPALYDPHVVAGIFLYKDEKNEIDIEFSRWGDADNYQLGNYVIQPAELPGNQFRFPILTEGSYTTHRIEWKPDEINFSSWHGHHPEPPPGQIIAQWQYSGRYVPIGSELRLFFNLWLFQGIYPKHDRKENLIISNFTYEPLKE
jgi:hypothetical protein